MYISNYTHSFLNHLHHGIRPNQTRDWLILLIFSGIAFLGIVIWNVWTFETIANGGIVDTSVIKTPPIFDRSSLDTVRAIFENRAAEEIKYEKGTYHYADPSQ